MKLLTSLAMFTAASVAFNATASEYTFCSGSEGGFYNQTAALVASNVERTAQRQDLDITIKPLVTNGSLDNIDRYNSGQCDIMIVQPDALNLSNISGQYDVYTAHTEAAGWISNAAYGIHDMKKIRGDEDEYRVVIVDGSGADVTMRSFVKGDKRYAGLYEKAIWADDLYHAMSIVANGRYNYRGQMVKPAGLLTVFRPGSLSPEFAKDFGGKVRVGELTDGDFFKAKAIDGSKLYKKCSIDKNALSGLRKSVMFGSPSSVCMQSLVIVNRDAIKDRAHRTTLSKAINRATSGN